MGKQSVGKYSSRRTAAKNGWLQYAKKYTKLKSGFIDVTLMILKMCSTYGESKILHHSTVDFLNKKAEIRNQSREIKGRLKKKFIRFSGFKIKVIPKEEQTRLCCQNRYEPKALKKAKTNLKLGVRYSQTYDWLPH